MCKVLLSCKYKQATGYKVAIKIGNQYFSPATGVEYKVGKVPIPDYCVRLSSHFTYDFEGLNLSDEKLIYNRPSFYSRRMVGKTAVFHKLTDTLKSQILYLANAVHRGAKTTRCNVVILKMTITEELTHGLYDSRPVILGKKIKAIKEFGFVNGNTYRWEDINPLKPLPIPN